MVSAIKMGSKIRGPHNGVFDSLLYSTLHPQENSAKTGARAAWPAEVSCRVYTDRDMANIASREFHPHRVLRWPPPLRESCGWTGVSLQRCCGKTARRGLLFGRMSSALHLWSSSAPAEMNSTGAPCPLGLHLQRHFAAAGGLGASPGVARPMESLSMKHVGKSICAAGYSSGRARFGLCALTYL